MDSIQFCWPGSNELGGETARVNRQGCGYNPAMTVQNPHDKFFRESFGRIHIARNYLEEYLPEALQQYQPNFRYHLSDFSHLSDEPIR